VSQSSTDLRDAEDLLANAEMIRRHWPGAPARLWCKFSDGRRVAGDGVSDQAARTAFQSAGAAWSLKRRRLREN